jgi:hypothetical protein
MTRGGGATREPGGFGGVLLAAGLLVALGLGTCFAPVARCPYCRDWERGGKGYTIPPPTCPLCDDAERVSLYAKWTWKRQQIKPAGPS